MFTSRSAVQRAGRDPEPDKRSEFGGLILALFWGGAGGGAPGERFGSDLVLKWGGFGFKNAAVGCG